jgi:hypothetical protein
MSRTAPKIGTIRVTIMADTRGLLILFDGPEKLEVEEMQCLTQVCLFLEIAT